MIMNSHGQIVFAAFAFFAQWMGAGQIAGVVIDSAGAPFTNAWVMTCNGHVTKVQPDGTFSWTGLSNGGYALKAVSSGMEDAFLTQIAVTSEVPVFCRLQMKPSPGVALVTGQVTDALTGKKVAAWFEIRNNTKPIRWFDIAGRPYGGRTDIAPPIWHQKNKRYWTSGAFAFSAQPGELILAARADGYVPATVKRVIRANTPERIEIVLQPLFNPAAIGWFKGDFHAHGVHGESLYAVNIPFMSFILRAENYHWFYLSSSFNNDGVPVDNEAIANRENGADLFLALNAEYPKTSGGHVGTIGIAPPRKPLPYPAFSNTEAIHTDVFGQGGAAIPVHPLTGHMKSRELPFLILGAPELICGFDFYTSWSERLEKTWALFLNQGYMLCRTATSDTAFDLGRTPGTMGATFIHPKSGRINRDTIVEAFKKGQTTISWGGALLLLTIDGASCGEIFPSSSIERHAMLTLYGTPGQKTQITVTRNGETFKRFSLTVPPIGQAEVSFTLCERKKAWYTALCATDGKPESVIAAASPFYFGTWDTPPPVSAQIDLTVFDAETKEPLAATISLTASGKDITRFPADDGKLHLEARTFQRLSAHAEGYSDQEVSILGTDAIRAFIASVSEEDLQTWDTYEKARTLLQTVKIDFSMKRK